MLVNEIQKTPPPKKNKSGMHRKKETKTKT